MKTKKQTEKTTRARTGDAFKEQTLKRAELDGVALVAKDLGIAEIEIYAWRSKRQIEAARPPEAGCCAPGRGKHVRNVGYPHKDGPSLPSGPRAHSIRLSFTFFLNGFFYS